MKTAAQPISSVPLLANAYSQRSSPGTADPQPTDRCAATCWP